MAAEDCEPRLLGRLDDVERDAGLLANPLRELVSVARSAARFGGDGARERNVAPPQLIGANRESSDGAVHRLLRQCASPRHPFTEANDAGKCVDDGKATVA